MNSFPGRLLTSQKVHRSSQQPSPFSHRLRHCVQYWLSKMTRTSLEAAKLKTLEMRRSQTHSTTGSTRALQLLTFFYTANKSTGCFNFFNHNNQICSSYEFGTFLLIPQITPPPPVEALATATSAVFSLNTSFAS